MLKMLLGIHKSIGLCCRGTALRSQTFPIEGLSSARFIKIYQRTFNAYFYTSPTVKSYNHTYFVDGPSLQVINCGGAEGVAVALNVGTNRYLFNCGESTERLLKDDSHRVKKFSAIFITHLSWRNIGGIPSLAMFLQEKGDKYLQIRGPRGIDRCLETAGSFCRFQLNEMDVFPNEGEAFCEGDVKVVSIPIKNRNPLSKSTTALDSMWHSDVKMSNFYNYEGEESQSNSLRRKPQGPVDLNTSYAYICSTQSNNAPKLSLSKCVEKGIPPGPLVQKILEGEDVTLEDGSVIKCSDFYDSPKLIFCALVDCPTEGYVDDLVESKDFEPLFVDVESAPSSVVVHFTPSSVMQTTRYISWMKQFPERTIHLIVNDANSPPINQSVLRTHGILESIHPLIFPHLNGTNLFRKPLQNIKSDMAMPRDSAGSLQWCKQWQSFPKCLRLVESRSFTLIDLKRSIIKRDAEPCVKQDIHKDEQKYREATEEAIQTFLDKSESLKNAVLIENHKLKHGPRLTFLGTGSKSSSIFRGCPGILMQISEDKSVLLDCGEGSYNQLSLMFDTSELQKILASLSAVYISHLHADHHLGLISVLIAHKKAVSIRQKRARPLLLLAPEQIVPWLSLFHYNYEPILDNVSLIPLRCIELARGGLLGGSYDVLVRDHLDMNLVCTCRVDHCIGAFGVSFIHKSGWKLTYSGDTKFSPSLIKMGMDSDVLIHEATFSNVLRHMAKVKHHSTTGDAVKAGQLMKAKHIILTHFSQRYKSITDLYDLKLMDTSNVCFEDLPTLPLLNDVYPAFFPDEVEELRKLNQRYRRVEALRTHHKLNSTQIEINS